MTNEPNETDDLQPNSDGPELEQTPESEIEDPIGDVTDGEAQTAIGAEIEATDESEPETADSPGSESEEDEPEFNPKPRPPAKLERLQKILAQAGVASRRKAEEMIDQGRVQINGKVITELGTKADAGRDHIRVDGKLLQGAERLRYFVLNKPKGFVTTVKDPEGRPTVMQFFDKMRERLYPVGRLDYMSEGLLLVTNDGELANRLTRAASGVEKTYLVKVAGQPTEDQLDLLRGGVAIERGKPGSGQVRTSPARIRQVRQGDNPWYEVVLIEGRNRELRKMFEEIGHFVEKIRRVGYGPLVLDQEPGNLRELQPRELEALRQVAEGKARTPKSKELRRRNAADAAQLPTVAPRPTVHPRPAKPIAARPFEPASFNEGSAATGRPGEFRPKRSFGSRAAGQGKDRPSRPARPDGEGSRPAASAAQKEDRPRRSTGAGPAKFGSARPASQTGWKKEDRPISGRTYGDKPARGKTYRDKPTGRTYGAKPATGRPYAGKPAEKTFGDKPAAGRAFGSKPATKKWEKPAGSGDRPGFKRPAAPRREERFHDEDLGPVRPPNLHIEEIQQSDRPSYARPSRPTAPRAYTERSSPGRSRPGRPVGGPSTGRFSSARPFRSEGGLARPFTTSSGKPRAGGLRPSSKPSKAGGARSYGTGSSSARPSSGSRTGSGYRPAPGGKRTFDRPSAGSDPRSPRPYTPRAEGTESRPPSTRRFAGSSGHGTGPRSESASFERKTGSGWKPKPNYGPGKAASGPHSKPAAGGFSKSGYKAKPSGPRPGGKRPAGKKRT